MKVCIFAVMLFLCSTSIFAQVQKFGKVEKSEVEMINPTIPAEVLFDHGKIELGNQYVYALKRHTRIKIHTSEGLDQGIFAIPFNAAEEQVIEKLEAVTYIMNNRGKLEKHKLNIKSDVVEQDLSGGWKRLVFRMPQIREGAVIELRYIHKVGDAFLIPDWEFDNYIPVRWSELEAIIPVRQEFNLVSRLSKDFHINTVDETKININFDYTPEMGHNTSQKRVGKMKSPAQHYRWVVKDLAATRREPQISSINNYREKIFFQFSAFSAPGKVYREYASSWTDISELLSEDNKFGLQLGKNTWSQSVVDGLFANEETTESKIEKVFDYVRSFEWNNEYDFYVRENLEEVNRTKSGNSAELNLLAIKLLRQADISAFPVLVSTRGHGRVSKDFVLTSQFNHVVFLVELGGSEIVMDILDSRRGGLVPKYLLNGEGLVINRYTPRWVNLEKQISTDSLIKYQLEFNGDESIKGNVELKSVGYDALDQLRKIEDMGEREFTQEYVLSGIGNASARSDLTGAPDFYNSNLALNASFTAPVKKDDSNSLLIQPVIFKLIEENPFKDDVRQLPIEFAYTFTRTTQVEVKIPDGYTLEQLPQTKSIRLPRKAISYIETYSQNEDTITIIRRVVVGKTVYAATDYEVIKRIFEVASAESVEWIALKKDGI